MSDHKFREFWISEDECLPTFFYSPKDFTDYYTQMIELQARLDMPTPIHVIEKSAYDALTKERDAWREQAEKLAEALKAVRPYVAVSTPATLYSAKNLEKFQGLINEALAAFKKERGEL